MRCLKFFFLLSILFFLHPTSVEARVTAWSEETTSFTNVNAYSFELETNCGSTLMENQLESVTHYLFTPGNPATANRLMIFLHGDDNSYTFDQFCSGDNTDRTNAQVLGACHAITEQPNAAILVLSRPSSVANGTAWFSGSTESDVACLMDEINNVLTQGRVPASAQRMYGAWSGGANAFSNILPYLSNVKVSIFDGCYSDRCQTMATSENIDRITFYYNTIDGNEDERSIEAISLAPTKAVGILVSKNHYMLPAVCALDSITPSDVCYGFGMRDPTTASQVPEFTADDVVLEAPRPQIQIPGLQFSSVSDLVQETENGGISVQIPFLAEYIGAIYRLSIGVIGILAIIIIIVSGIQMMTPGNVVTKGSGDQKETVNQAKQRIIAAITGLLLIIGSYTILFLINPNLVSITPLDVQFVSPDQIEVDIIAPVGDGKWPEGVDPPEGALPIDFRGNPIPPLIGTPAAIMGGVSNRCSKELLIRAFDELHALNICVGACHCAYTASYILAYADCGVRPNGSAPGLTSSTFYQLGWRPVPAAQATTDMWGLLTTGDPDLFNATHVGVLAGDGQGNIWQFDSGNGSYDVNDAASYYNRVGRGRPGGATCPSSKEYWNLDPMSPGLNCVECSLIPPQAPITGNYAAAFFNQRGQAGYQAPVQATNGGDTCKSTQIWTKRPYEPTRWKFLLVPPEYSGPIPT